MQLRTLQRRVKPIESTFATVRLRTTKTRGCVSRAGLLAMVFKLVKTAEQNWRTSKGHALLAQVVQGVQFKDGLQEDSKDRRLMLAHTQHLQKTPTLSSVGIFGIVTEHVSFAPLCIVDELYEVNAEFYISNIWVDIVMPEDLFV